MRLAVLFLFISRLFSTEGTIYRRFGEGGTLLKQNFPLGMGCQVGKKQPKIKKKKTKNQKKKNKKKNNLNINKIDRIY